MGYDVRRFFSGGPAPQAQYDQLADVERRIRRLEVESSVGGIQSGVYTLDANTLFSPTASFVATPFALTVDIPERRRLLIASYSIIVGTFGAGDLVLNIRDTATGRRWDFDPSVATGSHSFAAGGSETVVPPDKLAPRASPLVLSNLPTGSRTFDLIATWSGGAGCVLAEDSIFSIDVL